MRSAMRTGPRQKTVEIVDQEVVYQGHYRVGRYRLRHSLYAGGMGQEISREVFERGDAVAVLPYDPHRDEVVLIEQFRVAAELQGDDPWMLEIVAGLIEPGEDVEEVAGREAQEEAGLELGRLFPVARYYASPGASTEHVTLFCALVDAGSADGIHGLDEEGEDIRVIRLPFADVSGLLDGGLLRNGPVLIGLQWLVLNRDRLRAEAGA